LLDDQNIDLDRHMGEINNASIAQKKTNGKIKGYS